MTRMRQSQRWEAQARRIAEELGAKMVREAGNAALKGTPRCGG